VVSPALAGDYNADGHVDGTDFGLWQRTLGSTTQLAADGNGNGVIDAGDYNVWHGNYGAAAGGTTVGVPEPRSMNLFCVLGVTLAFAQRMKKGLADPWIREAVMG
jgi:hypothetical protein